eukprot:TRINITY_DN1572_c0_g1_i3.p1 TRINITY_DN1572_c0_g1~~TRINITY_DN1572_c0_g1_i3.p1  ORF type:complete len:541 (-),score=156.78 TRINITY_DN1572_c0_g1_i3:274-1896(-)
MAQFAFVSVAGLMLVLIQIVFGQGEVYEKSGYVCEAPNQGCMQSDTTGGSDYDCCTACAAESNCVAYTYDTRGPWCVTWNGPGKIVPIIWETTHVFNDTPVTCDQPVAVPTQQMVDWALQEVGALVHFNMETYTPNGMGCIGQLYNASLFDPVDLNLPEWMKAIQSFGGKYAVLVTKHMCGFTMWPTNASAGNFTYEYNVMNSPFQRDLVFDFVDAARDVGLRTGFYYCLLENIYLNVQKGVVQPGPLMPGQANITQEQYVSIVTEQLTELWSTYGPLDELWFDGGFPAYYQQQLSQLVQLLQPNAVAFGGMASDGTTLSNNSARWIGTEAGTAYPDTWSPDSAAWGPGDPNSPLWVPPECDTTLMTDDRWFYSPIPIRSLADMVDVYHNTVGHNCVLMLDLAPNQQGRIDPAHLARYQELGSWITGCYASPAANLVTNGTGQIFAINYTRPTELDRFVIQEDQRPGQLVRQFEIDVLLSNSTGADWLAVYSGAAIGNKRIALLDAPIVVDAVRLLILQYVKQPPRITFFAGFNCTDPSD